MVIKSLSLIALLSLSFSVNAAVVNLTANLDCAAAAAGVGTCGSGGTGSGLALITLDDQTNLLTWNISWSGLSGDIFAAHFHGPAAPNQSASPFLTLDISSNPIVDSTIVSAAQASDLLANQTYINLHTSTFGSGEIRGQVLVNPVPVPASIWLLGSALIGLVGIKRKK